MSEANGTHARRGARFVPVLTALLTLHRQGVPRTTSSQLSVVDDAISSDWAAGALTGLEKAGVVRIDRTQAGRFVYELTSVTRAEDFLRQTQARLAQPVEHRTRPRQAAARDTNGADPTSDPILARLDALIEGQRQLLTLFERLAAVWEAK